MRWLGIAVLALLHAGCGPPAEELVARLRDGAPEERRRAAEALGKSGDAAAVRPLCAALTDPEQPVREEAARALGQIGAAAAVGCLAKTLGRDDLYTQSAAVDALAAIGREASGAMLAALPRTRGIVRNKLAAAAGRVDDPRAAAPLRNLLARADGAERGAAHGLVALGRPDLLLPFLAEPPDSPRRRAAAQALRRARDPASVAALEKALHRRDGNLDPDVAQTLALRGRLDPLIAVLDARAPAAHRRVAADALAASPNRRAELALDRAIARRDLAAVAGAHVRLIRLGRPETEPLLLAALAAGGDETMARRFWECGNPTLREAGKAWFEAHGMKEAGGRWVPGDYHYVILSGATPAPREPDVRWGRP
ncbi:MAG TPA: HEAT repeat domain-containing protein [Thermoanaerobaculia bacterium]|nr:HEAT repeat domain-containing protein [Thermoanaerobaculia bacterium]